MTPEEIEHERTLERAQLALPHLGENTLEIARTLEVLVGQVVASSARKDDWPLVIEAIGARALRYAQGVPADFLTEAHKHWPKEPGSKP